MKIPCIIESFVFQIICQFFSSLSVVCHYNLLLVSVNKHSRISVFVNLCSLSNLTLFINLEKHSGKNILLQQLKRFSQGNL